MGLVSTLIGCLTVTMAGAASPAVDQGLLIVAPAKLVGSLQDFAAFKRNSLPTRVVSLETTLKSPGYDDPEKLKHYLFNAWKKEHMGYVLLVGDGDIMPMRYMTLDRVTPAAFDTAFYPSDMYYADLAKQEGTFEDWNGNKASFHSGYFGEVHGEKNKGDVINFDGIDYRPEIAVGRWPVDSPEEVAIVTQKTMRYEKSLASGTKHGSRTASLFAVGGWIDSRPTMTSYASTLKGWNVDLHLYGSRNNRPDESELDRVLNEGVGLICHAGHGSDNTWEGCFVRANLSRVNNADRLPVMISVGCSTARFAVLPPYEPYIDVSGNEHRGSDNGELFNSPPPPPSPYQTGKFRRTGLGTQLVCGSASGAVAYIGCNTGSQPCALTLQTGFVESVSKGGRRLGDCWNDAIRFYYDHEHLDTLKPNLDWYPPSIFFQSMKYMVFGDPSIKLP